eukprot:2088875-Heterocapsa_arctica.AAC.1
MGDDRDLIGCVRRGDFSRSLSIGWHPARTINGTERHADCSMNSIQATAWYSARNFAVGVNAAANLPYEVSGPPPLLITVNLQRKNKDRVGALLDA